MTSIRPKLTTAAVVGAVAISSAAIATASARFHAQAPGPVSGRLSETTA